MSDRRRGCWCRRLRLFRETELGGLAGDSFYVGIWQAAVSIADLAQIALITHALGLHEYGRLALVVSFVVLVGQFFDVRVSTAATTFGARALAHGSRRAATVFRLSFALDAITGVVGFVVVAALAFLVGPNLIGTDGTGMVVLYALILLVSTVDDTSLSILRLLDRYRLVAAYTVPLEVLRVGLVAFALQWHSLTAVLGALIVADAMAAIANFLVAKTCFFRATGRSIMSPAGAPLEDDRSGFLRMILHTNLVSYARLAQAQVPALMIGALVGATQTGLYKIGMAVATAIGRLADPAYAALLPRISRLWVAGRQREIWRLIQRATLVATPIMALLLAAIVLLRMPILGALGGGQRAEAAGGIVIYTGIAFAINGALFWNMGVLYAAGRSASVSRIALTGALIQLVLLPPLITSMAAEGAAVAFMVSLGAMNIALTWLAIEAVLAPTSLPPPPGAPTAGEAHTSQAPSKS